MFCGCAPCQLADPPSLTPPVVLLRCSSRPSMQQSQRSQARSMPHAPHAPHAPTAPARPPPALLATAPRQRLSGAATLNGEARASRSPRPPTSARGTTGGRRAGIIAVLRCQTAHLPALARAASPSQTLTLQSSAARPTHACASAASPEAQCRVEREISGACKSILPTPVRVPGQAPPPRVGCTHPCGRGARGIPFRSFGTVRPRHDTRTERPYCV